jgi:hypothetical protein
MLPEEMNSVSSGGIPLLEVIATGSNVSLCLITREHQLDHANLVSVMQSLNCALITSRPGPVPNGRKVESR